MEFCHRLNKGPARMERVRIQVLRQGPQAFLGARETRSHAARFYITA